ncbi:muscarinic acetylcholine receptor M2-like [Amphiura filiformis]|uniref:muscarinic acetylcholine receptor M2-like n=1 Tax=Amphiura filiformis TaxID=82378 RepID=UPI003B215EF3
MDGSSATEEVTEVNEEVTEITDYFWNVTTLYNMSTVNSGIGRWPIRPKLNLQVWSFEIKILMACICGLVAFTTVFGNILVLVSYFTNRQLRTYVNYFICGLAMVDLIEGGFVQPLYALYWILGYWPFSRELCEAYKYINHVTGHTTYLFTLVICIDRYRALTRPFEHLKERTYRHAVFLMTIAWVIPILSWFGPLFIWPMYGETKPRFQLSVLCIPYYSISKLFTLFVTCYVSWIPILMICVMYVKIYSIMRKAMKMKARSNTLALNKSICSDSQTSFKTKKGFESTGVVNKGFVNGEESMENDKHVSKKAEEDYNEESRSTIEAEEFEKVSSHRPESSRTTGNFTVSFKVHNPLNKIGSRSSLKSSKDKIQRQNIRATKVLSMIVVVVLISRVPWSVFAVYNVLCGPLCLPSNLYQVVLFTSHLPSALNPFCYAIANPQFKNTFISLLCCFRCRNVKQATDNNNSST